jgi:hypothetical protein
MNGSGSFPRGEPATKAASRRRRNPKEAEGEAMTNTLYMLDADGEPVETDDLLEWCRWFETADRSVGDTHLGPLRVSTAFLGVPHCDNSLTGDGFDFLWETMVFGPTKVVECVEQQSGGDHRSLFAKILGTPDFQRRYRTRQEAEAGHEKVVELVRSALAASN